MADFVASIPEGRIVAVAVRDEASRLLNEEAVQALRTIGAGGDMREKFRWGHAVIGVKGAQPGQAVESFASLRPAVVYVGEGTTEPHLAAAFGLVRFVTMEDTNGSTEWLPDLKTDLQFGAINGMIELWRANTTP
jgi:hypothetical protein